MSIQEFYDYRDHPVAKKFYKKVRNIIYFLYSCYRINENFALYKTQMIIINDLLKIENDLSNSKEKIKKLRREASLLSEKPNFKTSQNLKGKVSSKYLEVNEINKIVRILKYFRWIYRYIGDGVAWRAYGYDREIIRALCDKQPVPVFSNSQGIEKELNFFSGIRRLGPEWLPIMHDITNCLRTADFSIFRSNSLYKIIELKIRKSDKKKKSNQIKDKRELRQAKRLKNISTFLETGDLGILREELIGGKSITAPVQEKYNFELISKVIKTAKKKGYGIEEAEYGLIYFAWNIKNVNIKFVMEEALSKYPHVFSSPLIFRAFGARDDEKPCYFPLTATELNPGQVIDILFNNFSVICMLNIKCLEENAKKASIPLVVENRNGKLAFKITSKPEGEVREGLIDRVLIEGLSLNSFFDLIKYIMEEFLVNE